MSRAYYNFQRALGLLMIALPIAFLALSMYGCYVTSERASVMWGEK